MVARAGKETSDLTRKLAVKWGILFGVLLLAFGATVVSLNLTLYSASGFTASYLDSLARHDVDGALAMPGVEASDGALPTLLSPDAMGSIADYSLARDVDVGDGRHRVTYEVLFGGGATGATTFVVEHTGARMGVFSGWRFAQSPLGVLEVTPQHDAEFEVNGMTIVGPDGAAKPYRYQVLTPGTFTLGHDSKYLTAEPITVIADNSVDVVSASVDIQASAEFVDEVNVELAAYLDDCTTQQVLLPTDCPFGQPMSNRIEGLPVWSMSGYPEVHIVPGDEPGTWLVPPTPAAAHLVVGVRSLFDGSLSTFDEDVPFTVEYTITFPGDGTLHLEPR